MERTQQFDLQKIGIEQKYGAEQNKLQREYEKLEAQKNRAFQAGESEKGRQFERQQMKLQQQFEALESHKQREFQAVESEKNRVFEKEMKQEELGAERQRIYSEMMGKDPVRAALYAMGVGGEILPGGEQFGGLPPMSGAFARGESIEQALTGLLGGQAQPTTPGVPGAVPPGAPPTRTLGGMETPMPTMGQPGASTAQPMGGGIKLGAGGVTGMPEVIKAATAYQRGGAPAKTLLESAYGVGATAGKGRPGVSPEETRRLVQSVTPTGTLGG